MSAPKSFQIYEKRHASGNTGYRLDLGLVAGKRVFKNFPTREKAEAAQKKLRKEQAAKNPLLLADINASTRHEILHAVEKLKDYRATITEAVDFYLKHARPAKADATIGEIMDRFKAVKTKAGLSKKYLDTSWSSFFVPFRDAFKNCIITEVTSDAADSDSIPNSHPGNNTDSNSANFYRDVAPSNDGVNDGFAFAPGVPQQPMPASNTLTSVGSYTLASSYYGTFDQGGNVDEWTDTVSGISRIHRGGTWYNDEFLMRASTNASNFPEYDGSETGFRVSTVPEPTSAVLLLCGAAIFIRRRTLGTNERNAK